MTFWKCEGNCIVPTASRVVNISLNVNRREDEDMPVNEETKYVPRTDNQMCDAHSMDGSMYSKWTTNRETQHPNNLTRKKKPAFTARPPNPDTSTIMSRSTPRPLFPKDPISPFYIIPTLRCTQNHDIPLPIQTSLEGLNELVLDCISIPPVFETYPTPCI